MKTIRRAALILAPFLLFGCAHSMISERDRLLVSARFGELQKHVEAEISRTGVADTPRLFPLCVSYSALKRYDRLFDCCDRLEANIRRGDKSSVDFEEMARDNPLVGGIARMQSAKRKEIVGDVSPWPFLLRARAYIDLGQYDKAIENAQKAYDIEPEGKQQRRPSY